MNSLLVKQSTAQHAIASAVSRRFKADERIVSNRPKSPSAGDGDIVIHERTGELFNKTTKEFVW